MSVIWNDNTVSTVQYTIGLGFDMLSTGVQGLEGAVGLKALVVSFNELSSMEGLTSLTRLTRLDLSFNAIPRIQGLKVARVWQMFTFHRFLCFSILN